MSGYNEEYIESAKEYKSCFGNYYDDSGAICQDADYCSYCVECRRQCKNY